MKKSTKTESFFKSEGIVFGGAYKPKPNPFRHTYRMEYAELILLGAIVVFFIWALKMGGAI